jgi:hypothetical protein
MLSMDWSRTIRLVGVIKTHGKNFRMLTLGNSDRIQVGEEVVAIGNPLSLESTVSSGIVSGVRTVQEEGGNFLQVTAPICPGSSGGPLFNMAGEVVAITTLYLKGGENLNFAIPINDAKHLLLTKPSQLQTLPNESESTQGDAPLSPYKDADMIQVFFWANDLYTACSDVTFQAGEPISQKSVEKGINKGYCAGLILGYSEAWGNLEGVCRPPHSDPNDIVEGVKAILDKSPALRDKQLPASSAVGIALQQLFPCSAKH